MYPNKSLIKCLNWFYFNPCTRPRKHFHRQIWCLMVEKKKTFFVYEKGQILNKIKMFVAGYVFKLGRYRSFCLQIAASWVVHFSSVLMLFFFSLVVPCDFVKFYVFAFLVWKIICNFGWNHKLRLCITTSYKSTDKSIVETGALGAPVENLVWIHVRTLWCSWWNCGTWANSFWWYYLLSIYINYI